METGTIIMLLFLVVVVFGGTGVMLGRSMKRKEGPEE